MMPYSDNPPALVLPDSRQAREWLKKCGGEDPTIAFCREYKDYGHWQRDTCDENRPMEINACDNRRCDGVRYNNWCYRCMAGFPFVPQHVYDAERPSDRTIDLDRR